MYIYTQMYVYTHSYKCIYTQRPGHRGVNLSFCPGTLLNFSPALLSDLAHFRRNLHNIVRFGPTQSLVRSTPPNRVVYSSQVMHKRWARCRAVRYSDFNTGIRYWNIPVTPTVQVSTSVVSSEKNRKKTREKNRFFPVFFPKAEERNDSGKKRFLRFIQPKLCICRVNLDALWFSSLKTSIQHLFQW